MLARSRAVIGALALVMMLAAPPPASAAPSLCAPVPGRALLGFGEAYGSRVHGGLDLAAPAGAEVSAPVSGTVSFAGRLPSAEGDVLAVTIVTAEGLKVTCLPLTSAAVAKGAAVEAGDTLGTLSGEGDASSAETHVHLSVRDGETYLDPAALLSSPPEPPPSEAAPVKPAPDPGPGPAPVEPASVPPDAAPSGHSPRPAPAPAPSPIAHAPSPLTAGADTPAARSLRTEGAAPAAAAARALSTTARALHAPVHVPHPHPLAPVSRAATLDAIARVYARLRAGVTALAVLLVAAACLWPVWRRLPAPAGEVEPVRIRV